MTSSPLAFVRFWDGTSVYVRCPYCEKIHCHGFDGKYGGNHTRVSHCNADEESYEYRFPDCDTTGFPSYEIDKERVLFVAADADPDEYFREKVDGPVV